MIWLIIPIFVCYGLIGRADIGVNREQSRRDIQS